MPEFQIRFIRIRWWQFMLGAGIALALLIAFFVLALGFFLFLLPAIAVLGAIFYLFGGRQRPVGQESATNDRIIDGDYRVIEQNRIEHRDRSH
jgi:hypothetical protein